MPRDEARSPTTPLINRIWISSDDAAELLQISRRALYHRVERGQLPAHRLGRCLRFKLQELEAALELRPLISEN